MTDMTDVYQPNVSEQLALYRGDRRARRSTLDGRTGGHPDHHRAKSGNNPKNPVMRIKRSHLCGRGVRWPGAPETLRGTTTLCAHPEVLLQDAGDREIPVMALEPIKH